MKINMIFIVVVTWLISGCAIFTESQNDHRPVFRTHVYHSHPHLAPPRSRIIVRSPVRRNPPRVVVPPLRVERHRYGRPPVVIRPSFRPSHQAPHSRMQSRPSNINRSSRSSHSRPSIRSNNRQHTPSRSRR